MPRQSPLTSVRSATLSPYERNARKHSAASVRQLVSVIDNVGWTSPILADEDGIVAGHKRRLAALAIYGEGRRIHLPNRVRTPGGDGPGHRLHRLVRGAAPRLSFADNQTTLSSEWDAAVLKLELSWLEGSGEVDMGLTGFDGQALAKALGVGGGTEGAHEGEQAYTRKIKAPIYGPKGDAPAPAELYDDEKTRALVDRDRRGGPPGGRRGLPPHGGAAAYGLPLPEDRRLLRQCGRGDATPDGAVGAGDHRLRGGDRERLREAHEDELGIIAAKEAAGL